MRAFVLVKVTTGSERAVMEAFHKVPSLQEINVLFGDFDYILEVDTADEASLGELITEHVRKVPGVEKTLTLLVTSIPRVGRSKRAELHRGKHL